LLKIRPLKVEEINEDPYIVMLRDVLYDNEIEYIKKRAAPLVRECFPGVPVGEGRGDIIR
jgi:hypothetical protein